MLKLAKAFDIILADAQLSYKYCAKAFKIMDKLVTERQEAQPTSSKLYQIILAPFYYKFGDSITTFIELNTDEFGNVKTLQQDDSSEEEEEDESEEEA